MSLIVTMPTSSLSAVTSTRRMSKLVISLAACLISSSREMVSAGLAQMSYTLSRSMSPSSATMAFRMLLYVIRPKASCGWRFSTASALTLRSFITRMAWRMVASGEMVTTSRTMMSLTSMSAPPGVVPSDFVLDLFLEQRDLSRVDAGDVLERDREYHAAAVDLQVQLAREVLHHRQRQLLLQHEHQHRLAALVGQAEEGLLLPRADAARVQDGHAARAGGPGHVDGLLLQVVGEDRNEYRE